MALRQLPGSQEKVARVRKILACGHFDGQCGALLGSICQAFHVNQGIVTKVLLLWQPPHPIFP